MAGKLARATGRSSDCWLQAAFTVKGASARGARPSGIIVRQQIRRGIEDAIIGFDPSRVRRASIELTLDRAATTSGGKRFDLTAASGYRLKPGELIVVRTREEIALPRDYKARLGATAGGAVSALIPLAQLQIEPGSRGVCNFRCSTPAART
jgi:hypothetical protein